MRCPGGGLEAVATQAAADRPPARGLLRPQLEGPQQLSAG